MRAAFGKEIPKLPAVSGDGSELAVFESDAAGPMLPTPEALAIKSVGNALPDEQLDVIDDETAIAANAADWKLAPKLATTLHDRGTQVMARLKKDAFTSLLPLDAPVDANGQAKPIRLGTRTLTATGALDLGLTDARGTRVHYEHVAAYDQGTWETGDGAQPCHYEPVFRGAYTDASRRHVYFQIGFKFHEQCVPPPLRYVAWDLGAGTPEDEAAIAAVIDQQFDVLHTSVPQIFMPDAQLASDTGIGPPTPNPLVVVGAHDVYRGHADKNVAIGFAADGNTAWASLTTKLTIVPQNQKSEDDPWRASDVIVKTPAGWKIAAMAWSAPVDNGKVDKDAKAGALAALAPFTGDSGDPSLLVAFAKLTNDGVDAKAAASAGLVALGSAQGERTVGGASLAGGWNAGWKGRVSITSSIARLAPSRTTGWVAANIKLAKGALKIPYFVFCVFDKTASGEWTLVHMHFAI